MALAMNASNRYVMFDTDMVENLDLRSYPQAVEALSIATRDVLERFEASIAELRHLRMI
jgi:hypothetical protein